MAKRSNHDEIMSLREASRFVRASPASLRRAAAEGRVPAARLTPRGRWLFARSALVDWVACRPVRVLGPVSVP